MFGISKRTPLKEEHSKNPLNCYAHSKLEKKFLVKLIVVIQLSNL